MADETATAQATTDAAATTDAGKTAADTAANTVLAGADIPAGDGKTETPGDQGAGDKTGSEAGDGKKPDDVPAGAPEKYELALPDGYALDEAIFSKAEPVMRELNLTNEQASKLAGVIAEHRQAEVDAHIKTVEEWGKQAATDPVIGGAAFAENVTVAKRALEYVGDSELRTLLDGSGLGNHPAIIRAFVKLGALVPKEDGLVRSERSGGTKSAADVLFDHPTSPKP